MIVIVAVMIVIVDRFWKRIDVEGENFEIPLGLNPCPPP